MERYAYFGVPITMEPYQSHCVSVHQILYHGQDEGKVIKLDFTLYIPFNLHFYIIQLFKQMSLLILTHATYTYFIDFISFSVGHSVFHLYSQYSISDFRPHPKMIPIPLCK